MSHVQAALPCHIDTLAPQRQTLMNYFVQTESGHAENMEASPLAGEFVTMASEIAALRSQMRIFRSIAFGSLAVSMLVLALLGHSYMGPSAKGMHSATNVQASVTELDGGVWSSQVIVPYGFKACDSTAEPPQIAPIRQSGEFLFLSGILGYDTPCKTAVEDVTEQFTAAFKWANDTLTTAGVSWVDVMSVTSYHVGLKEHQAIFAKTRQDFLPRQPYPAWTAVGVNKLYFDHEVFEMTIIARRPRCVGLECDR